MARMPERSLSVGVWQRACQRIPADFRQYGRSAGGAWTSRVNSALALWHARTAGSGANLADCSPSTRWASSADCSQPVIVHSPVQSVSMAGRVREFAEAASARRRDRCSHAIARLCRAAGSGHRRAHGTLTARAAPGRQMAYLRQSPDRYGGPGYFRAAAVPLGNAAAAPGATRRPLGPADAGHPARLSRHHRRRHQHRRVGA